MNEWRNFLAGISGRQFGSEKKGTNSLIYMRELMLGSNFVDIGGSDSRALRVELETRESAQMDKIRKSVGDLSVQRAIVVLLRGPPRGAYWHVQNGPPETQACFEGIQLLSRIAFTYNMFEEGRMIYNSGSALSASNSLCRFLTN